MVLLGGLRNSVNVSFLKMKEGTADFWIILHILQRRNGMCPPSMMVSSLPLFREVVCMGKGKAGGAKGGWSLGTV